MSDPVNTKTENTECENAGPNNPGKPRPVIFIILCLFLLVVLLSGIILGDTELSPDPLLSYNNTAPVETVMPELSGN